MECVFAAIPLVGFIIWAAGVYLTYHISIRKLPERDPYLFPLAALISGWGLLTIWRLDSGLGFRQALWLAVSLGLFALAFHSTKFGLSAPVQIHIVGSGLVLTALTLLMGTNPKDLVRVFGWVVVVFISNHRNR